MANERPVTLITGAGTGIGLATAKILSSEGHRIALVGRRKDVLCEAGSSIGVEGEDWIAIPADVGEPTPTQALPKQVAQTFGRLDGLVNNAGWAPMKPVAEHSAEEVAKIFAVNVTGPILLMIEALAIMSRQNSGRIVNVSSMASDDPFPGLGVYGAAKSGLNTVTKGIAGELGPESPIRIFSVAPGAVETALLRSIISEDMLARDRCLSPDEVASVIADCVAGRRDSESGRTIWLPSP